MANNGGFDTLYHGVYDNSVQESSLFAIRVANSGVGGKYVGGKLAEILRGFRRRGYWFRLHRFRVNGNVFVYLKARKRVDGRVKEVTLARVSLSELEEVERIIKEVMGKASNRGNNSSRGNPNTKSRINEPGSSSNTIISSSKPGSRQHARTPSGNGDRGGVGGSAWAVSGSLVSGSGLFKPLFVHRVVLRFVRPWVSPLYLSEFGGVRFVERSKQYILRMEVGDRRWLTVQVNRDGTAQVFLEASDNPLGLEEFIGFSRFYLLWLFRRITGRSVGLEDFIVLAAPEFNLDLDGVNLLEGLGARSFTLEKFLSDIARIYYSDPGVKTTMPSGGTRVEARPSSYEGMNLKELVEGVAATAELPRFLSSLKKEIEEVKHLVKGGVSLKSLEKQGLADLVATKLANYLEILWKRIEARLQQWIRELAGKIAEALQGYINELLQRIRILEEENKRLKNRIQELKTHVKIDDEIKEYEHHPGWKKLLELVIPGPNHPALINIDLKKRMVYFSPELWRYIRSRTREGALRGLDKQLLNMIADYHGKKAVELILNMQFMGGRIPLSHALSIVSASAGSFKSPER